MSFICCDAEGSHDIVAILENRLTKTIREHFMNRYTNRERAAVKSVVVDLNAQYIKFIKALFPNARIIIDRFHIVQLVGRALGNARISLMKKMNDFHCREYKILKAHWRLFHKDSADLEAARSVYLRGVNEYTSSSRSFRRVRIVMSTATGQSRGARDRDKVWNRAFGPRAPGLLERQQASLPSESTWAERAAR